MLKQAICLAGGNNFRLRPDTFIPKPLLPIGKETLLGLQCNWLIEKHGFDKVLVATKQEVVDGFTPVDKVEIVVETEKLGTAGAIRNVLPSITEKYAYILNVDDLVLDSNPQDLYDKSAKHGNALLAAKPRTAFGQIQSRGDQILRFQEKPIVTKFQSVGHYVFKIADLQSFKSAVSLEYDVLPELAKRRKLGLVKWHGKWTSVNTYKDYQELINEKNGS